MGQTVDETERATTEVGRPAAAVSASPGPLVAPRTRRARTADLVRVLLFAGVVVAHSVNAINSAPDVVRSASLLTTFLHLTRYGFVAVTLFVLVLSTRGRPLSPLAFWRRRFGLIVAPFLVWSVLYSLTDHLVMADNPFPTTGEYFTSLARATVTGDAKYQLYFLLISMQIYFVFPLLAWILNRAGHRPWLLLSAGAAIQIVMFVIYQYLPRPQGPMWALAYEHAWKTLPMYALFVAIGMLAAHHHAAVEDWLRANAGPVIIACLLGSLFSATAYAMSTSSGVVPLSATTPWNPLLLPWLISGLVLLWLVAMAWDDLRGAGRAVGARFVSYATIRAFGVFAVHPLILDVLARVGFMRLVFAWFPHSATIRSTALVIAVLVLSLLVVDLFLRTPVSRWLTARDRIPLVRTAA
ncbi:acyltransferase [Gordonia hydrophobica]|uniref:acyltransferase n=1 Tax=Gordonia hydrophobica TaxID=40516 RepID=UPI003558A728|nr:peptidoglycan/LPS O-acetylase OafA/YrhL [Gordonia hydrophobica]